jgi:hypothetical protein
MHTVKFLAAIALCLTATVVQAAGFRFIEVPADAEGPALTGAMWYPCSKPPGAIDLGGIIVSPLTKPSYRMLVRPSAEIQLNCGFGTRPAPLQ